MYLTLALTVHTHILCKQKRILDAINRLTAHTAHLFVIYNFYVCSTSPCGTSTCFFILWLISVYQ